MSKQPIKIPFTYHYDEMMDYCDFKYVEGTQNDREIIWNTKENCRVYRFKDNEKKVDENLNTGKYIKVYEPVWKDNYEFHDVLFLDGMSRGRSAANFCFKSKTTGKSYNVFMTDMVDIINHSIINNGVVTGNWTFIKRGQNYGIRLIF